MKVQEFIQSINEAEEPFYALWLVQDSAEGVELVARAINPDNHRHYQIATDIYKCENGFVGVTGVERVFNESCSYEDCDVECKAEWYEEVQTITYRPIKKS